MSRPILVGVEVEANYPDNPTGLFRETLEKGQNSRPFLSGFHRYDVPTALVAWQAISETRSNANSWGTWWNDIAPESLKIPIGVYKSADGSCGLECKFDGPKTKFQAVEIIDRWMPWYKDSCVNSFNCAGTHVHVGAVDWLTEHIGDATSPEYRQAYALMFGALIAREKAIVGILPSWRRESTYCAGHMTRASHLFKPKWCEMISIDKDTSAQSFANMMLSAGSTGRPRMSFGFTGSSIVAQRHHPTFEFRLFPATNNAGALKGYVELVTTLWDELSSRFLKAPSLTQAVNDILVSPLKYDTPDLISEFGDNKALKKFLTEIVSVKGDPQRISSDEFVQTIPTTA